MILFFGPVGAGKSVQGQMLADKEGWRWLSTGQMFRETQDEEIKKIMEAGQLVGFEQTNRLVIEALTASQNEKNIILDGYPRLLEQAEWLDENGPKYGRSVELIIVLEVSKAELLKRVAARGRADDSPEILEERLKIYRKAIYPMLAFFSEKDVPIVHIDGVGEVENIHARIVEEVASYGLEN